MKSCRYGLVWAVKAEAKAVELLCDIAPDVPAALVGDPLRLRQILANLVGNAVKFTERGYVLLSLRVESRDADDVSLHFQVTDTGIGIPAAKQATIFDAFTQADGSTTRQFGGTGLGLTISASLVAMMQGRIWVDSVDGTGSTFHVTMPFAQAAIADAPVDDVALAGRRVLIVDDNSVNRDILVAQVRRWRMTGTAVDGARAALDELVQAAATGEPYTLVLLDAHMPDVDGFWLAERIKVDDALAGATIMMLSSAGRHDEYMRCRALGIGAYLTKPVRSADLFAAIRQVLGHSRAERIIAPREESPAPHRPLKVLLVEDNIVNQRVAIGLLKKRGHEVVLATNGLEAIAATDHEAFDLVLMDVQMPIMGGFEATAAIREREERQGGHLRIVAMTAHAMAGDADRCLGAGMDDYLSKPIDSSRLFAIVEATPAPSVVRRDH